MTLLLATMLWLTDLAAFNSPTPYLDGSVKITQPSVPEVYDNPLFQRNDEVWLLRLEDNDRLDELADMTQIPYNTLNTEDTIYVGNYTYKPLRNMTPFESAQIQLLFLILMTSRYPYTDESIDNWIKHYKLERHFK